MKNESLSLSERDVSVSNSRSFPAVPICQFFHWVVLCLSFVAKATPVEAGQAQWLEMVLACEDVISSQSFTPLQSKGSSAAVWGLPGSKEHTAYNESRSLMAVATYSDDMWVSCLVREREESGLRLRELTETWENEFMASFPQPQYLITERPRIATHAFHNAYRCLEDGTSLRVAPYIAPGLYFRVSISLNAPNVSEQLCSK